MFQAAYDSPWQHPGIAWIAGAPLLVVATATWLAQRKARDEDPRRRAFVLAFLILQVCVMLDAWLTGAFSPSFLGGPRVVEAAAVLFVILGDLRFFYLVERQRGPAAPSLASTARTMAIAVPVSLVVPVATGVAKVVWPVVFNSAGGHLLYLVYELGLLVTCITFCVLRAPARRDRGDGRLRYVRRLLRFEVVQYGTWVCADALILSGIDAGYLLRFVPNALYYAAFNPVAIWATPAGSRV